MNNQAIKGLRKVEIDPREKVKREIQVWMVRNGLRAADISREVGIKPYAGAVSHFIKADCPSKRLRDYFLKKGCPRHLLDELEKLRLEKLKKAA